MKNKKIIESWGKIRPSDATHNRILENILSQTTGPVYNTNNSRPVPQKRKVRSMTPYWKILAPFAACLLVAILVAVPLARRGGTYIPTPCESEPLTNGQYDTNPSGLVPAPPVDSENQAYPGATIDPTQTDQTRPVPPVEPTYELILNQVYGQMSPPSRIPQLTFTQPITLEDLVWLLPGLGPYWTARAMYLYDGSFMDIIAMETESDGETWAMFSEIYTRTSISLALGPPFTGMMFHNNQPAISYVYGIPVTASINGNIGIAGDGVAIFTAEFEQGGVGYVVTVTDYEEGDSGLSHLTEIVNTIIRNGVPDLNRLETPEIPELRNDQFTEDEAFADPDFGAYLPTYLPAGLGFGDARRSITQDSNLLTINWHEPWNSSISWWVWEATDRHHNTVVSRYDRHLFDLALYPIPWADTVPDEIRDFVSNPVFLAEEMCLEIVKARVLQPERYVRDLGPSISFGVLFGDVVVTINSSGLSPEEVWAMVSSLL